eukprot:4539455-Prymnesium_polylepis.1
MVHKGAQRAHVWIDGHADFANFTAALHARLAGCSPEQLYAACASCRRAHAHAHARTPLCDTLHPAHACRAAADQPVPRARPCTALTHARVRAPRAPFRGRRFESAPYHGLSAQTAAAAAAAAAAETPLDAPGAAELASARGRCYAPPVIWQSWYHLFLPRWLQLGPRVLLEFSDDAFTDADRTMARIASFLSLPPFNFSTRL